MKSGRAESAEGGFRPELQVTFPSIPWAYAQSCTRVTARS
jgi:hypothetical protein